MSYFFSEDFPYILFISVIQAAFSAHNSHLPWKFRRRPWSTEWPLSCWSSFWSLAAAHPHAPPAVSSAHWAPAPAVSWISPACEHSCQLFHGCWSGDPTQPGALCWSSRRWAFQYLPIRKLDYSLIVKAVPCRCLFTTPLLFRSFLGTWRLSQNCSSFNNWLCL